MQVSLAPPFSLPLESKDLKFSLKVRDLWKHNQFLLCYKTSSLTANMDV